MASNATPRDNTESMEEVGRGEQGVSLRVHIPCREYIVVDGRT